jgi:hypothetical protein
MQLRQGSTSIQYPPCQQEIAHTHYAECPGGEMPSKPFMLHIHGAQVFPAQVMRRPFGRPSNSTLPHNLIYGPGNLVLTGDNELTAESLTHRNLVPGRLSHVGNRRWTASLPKFRQIEDVPHVLLDLCSAHFGHALLDTPARLWWLTEEGFSRASRPRLVGFREHGLSRDPAQWPEFLRDILTALDIVPEEIWFPDDAVEFRSLYVPRRISPFGPGGVGAPYFRTMRHIGDRIVQNSETGRRDKLSESRAYLSRRKLKTDLRFILDDGEARLEEIFSARGFAIVHTQEHSLADQIQMIRSARHVAGAVGSQLHLLVFCQQIGTKLFKIAPSFFNYNIDVLIVEGIGGTVRTHVVPAEKGRFLEKSESPWRISEQEFGKIETQVDAWLRDGE